MFCILIIVLPLKTRVIHPRFRFLFFYNSTMCYDNDAKHWSNLANVRAIVSISPYGYQNVEISENWFATTIVASFFKGSHRIITYANSLNQNGTLSQYQSVL